MLPESQAVLDEPDKFALLLAGGVCLCQLQHIVQRASF